METRTIPELLQVLLDNHNLFNINIDLLIECIYFHDGISWHEKHSLQKYISDRVNEDRAFEPYEWPPRKEWLEKQIEYSKNFEE